MWNDVELLLNDDTGQLPVGLGQECGTALYQVDSLLQITSSEKVSVNPQLHACSSRDGSIIVVDRSVALLDSTGLSLLMHIQFDTNVDVVGMCQDKQFLVVGERSGSLHLIHIPSKQTLLTKVLAEQSTSEKTYLNLFFVKDNADAAIEKTDMTTAKQGRGDYVLSKWEVDPSNALVSAQSFADSSLIQGAAKLQVLDNQLFVLDTENILSTWDIYSLTLIWDWPLIHIEEFLLTTESDSSQVTWQGLANVKLIVMTMPDDKQMRSLMVFALPTMQQLYSLEVSLVSSLVQSGICADTIYFLEGIHEKHQMPSEEPVSIVVMRSLTEALPENRLSRLLHKHKFTEAENFAIQFGLDVELVYKVKANTILEKLAAASLGSYGQEALLDLGNEAKENLQKIQDSQFVVNYCINAPWPLYETTREMLNYAKVRILKKDNRTNAPPSDGAPVSIAEVLRAQARLTTFCEAFGLEKFSGIAWTEFLNNEDVFKIIVVQLEEGNLACAQYLWLRHQADFESSFDEKMLKDLLNAIHFTAPLKELCVWLQNFVIPFSRRVVPDGQKILANWLEQAARNLELTDKVNWPENGLQVAEVFFTSKNQGELGVTAFGKWTPLRCGDCEEIQRLKKLVNDLQELRNLYRKYNCRLAFCDFEKENAATIVFRMLDKILAPELVPSILEKFIKPYLCEHNLQKDELFLQYVKLKFDAVLQIMHGAVVPWCAAVEQLVRQHLEMRHVKVKLLQESYRLMEMKKLLRAYGIRDTNLLKDKQMIMRLVRYILKQDTPTCLEDALKIVEAYMLPTGEVYFLRMMDLIDKERGEESLTLLKSLPLAKAEEVAERLTLWGRLVLQNKADDPEEQNPQMFMTKTLVEVLKFRCSIQKDNPVKKYECEENLKMFETLATLQGYFDIFLSDEEYRNPSLISALLEDHISSYERVRSASKSRNVQAVDCNSEGGKPKTPPTESRLYRLALLLQVSEHELGEKLALRALEDGKVEVAVNICREFYENSWHESTGKLLFAVCQRLCQMLGADVPMITPHGLDLPAVIHQLAGQAATLCSPDLVLDCLELCKYTSLAKEIHGQCQMDNYEFTAETTPSGGDKDPYEEWTYDDFFKEDGIVLDPQTSLLVAYELTSALLPVCGHNFLLPVGCPFSAAVQNLLDCSQFQLALQLTVCAFGSCLLRGISNTMDLAPSEKPCDSSLLLTETRSFLTAMKERSSSVIRTSVLNLLHKVFNSRVIDQNLALGYCTVLPKEEMFNKLWEIINNSWQNYRKVLAVALVGAELAGQYGEAEEKRKFQELVIDAEWGIQLAKFGISFETVFRQPPVRKKELIRVLVQNPEVDTDLILNYCSTFMLDSDAALQLCIETLLLQNSNTNDVEDDSAESSERQPHSTLLAKALKIIPLLSSTKDLVMSLSGILCKLDPYDYETLEIVLRVIQSADEKNTSIQLSQALSLLKHLQSYTRISPPVDLEHQYVLEQMIPLSPAAHTRLPFHLLFFRTALCFWNIISAELSEETFPTLLLISKLMKDEPREKAEVLQRNLHLQYKRAATENVLITNNLNTGEHLKCIGKPANLIVLLYEHHSIDQRFQNPAGRDYPDIHVAAKEIAEINNLDMNKICDKLLAKWLCPSTPPPGPFGDTQLTFAHRTRAFRCLLYLADSSTVESLFKKPMEKVKYFLKCCIYLAEFEILNIPYTYESFHKSPKEGMIKGLWKNHSHEPRAVRLVTELSLEYKVYDPQLWNGLLQKLLGFNLIPSFSRAWRSVVLSPFLTASCPPSPAQLQECRECFVILLRCPVLADLDMVGIAKQYIQLDLPAFALGCLLVIPHSEKREQQIQISSLVLDSIINEKLYEQFWKTKYYPLLKQHLINTHRVKELVDYFAKNNCLDDATALIEEYQEKCGNPALADVPASHLLQMYLNGSEGSCVLELP
ncbi:hypothetical protein DUI87_17329 [Hirundo rustica rustica]|uniref:KNTC1 protein n=1 Tax=Hirundo rustica rustica TaxID=333673 RepID=A0A3M0JXS7_HIRRU|nr:hypothetical protein DUI87_17329 [Hirundo rustica rustica]